MNKKVDITNIPSRRPKIRDKQIRAHPRTRLGKTPSNATLSGLQKSKTNTSNPLVVIYLKRY